MGVSKMRSTVSEPVELSLPFLQRVARLLLRLLPRRRRLTVLDILLYSRPFLPLRAQLSRNHKVRRKLHHRVCRGRLVAEEKSTFALLQLFREIVEVLLHVDARAFFRLGDIAVFLEPAAVQYC